MVKFGGSSIDGSEACQVKECEKIKKKTSKISGKDAYVASPKGRNQMDQNKQTSNGLGIVKITKDQSTMLVAKLTPKS